MTKLKLEYSKSQIDKAGDALRQDSNEFEIDNAIDMLSNWRAIHLYPINTFQMTLRDKLRLLGIKNFIVAQRLKRTPSIISKLKKNNGMKLSRMQDIGGLRAVVDSLLKVRELEESYKKSKFDHSLVRNDDYILNPKDSGYRGIHLVYKYQNRINKEFNGLQIEIQIRTKLQHAWATSVETMSTYTSYALKSSEGPKEWLDFFALVSSAFAIQENTPKLVIHEKISNEKIISMIKKAEKKLNVIELLSAYSVVTDSLKNKPGRKGHFHLIVLNVRDKKVSIKSFSKIDLDKATDEYTKMEQDVKKEHGLNQVLLVQNVSIENLQRAYPNYFLDTKQFIKSIQKLVRS